MKEQIAILIPCYNEEQTIHDVVSSFRKVLPEAALYVYNNNSSDQTASVAEKAGAVVRNEYRQGKGNVVRSMFRDIDADCYLMVDGDNTYPAEAAVEIEKIILARKADMVIGDRLSSTYFVENKRLFHNFGNELVRKFINFLWKPKEPIFDVMTGMRALSPLFAKSFPVLSKGFEIETEMTIHAVDKNYRLVEVPVNYKDRPEGSVSKLNTVKDDKAFTFDSSSIDNMTSAINTLIERLNVLMGLSVAPEEVANITKKLSNALGVEDFIHFTGYIENPYLIIKNAYCMIFTSYFEGFPITVLEAFHCNTPVIGAKVAIPDEIRKEIAYSDFYYQNQNMAENFQSSTFEEDDYTIANIILKAIDSKTALNFIAKKGNKWVSENCSLSNFENYN